MSTSRLCEYPTVVFDIGSAYTKAGFSGDCLPRSVFSTVVGKFRKSNLIDGFPEIYCGEEAIRNRGISTLSWPIRDGYVNNWNDVEKIWHHAFYKELYAAPEEHKIMHSVHPLAPVKHKEMIAEILFESFNIKSLYLMNTPALALHASGRTSGLVWESGASSAFAAPVYEGFPLYHGIKRSVLTGEVFTKTLQEMLSKKGYYFTTAMDIDIINKIKENICYVASNHEEELTASQNSESNLQYTLPDGQQILIGEERFKCPEIFFQPEIGGLTCPNIVDTIISSIEHSEMELKPMFYENIVVGGGNAMFPDLKNRLQRELEIKTKGQSDIKINVDRLSTGQFSVWQGGSIVASLSSFKNSWINISQYEDSGSKIVHNYFS